MCTSEIAKYECRVFGDKMNDPEEKLVRTGLVEKVRFMSVWQWMEAFNRERSKQHFKIDQYKDKGSGSS